MIGNSQQSMSSQSKMRCAMCKKKIIFEYTCPCKGLFCIKCRVPELHNCTFDFRLEHQARLAKDNPVVVGEKVDKI